MMFATAAQIIFNIIRVYPRDVVINYFNGFFSVHRERTQMQWSGGLISCREFGTTTVNC